MNRFCCAFFLVAISAWAYADCQPNQDVRSYKRKQAGTGVEVVDLILAGATTVDSEKLTKIEKDRIGSCLDDKHSVTASLYSLFGLVRQKHVRLEDLKVAAINPQITPTPVQVRGNVLEEAHRCPADLRSLYQFLLDHRSNSLEADLNCVDSAFVIMKFAARFRHSRYYTKALVDLLDFERQDEDPGFSHHFVKYPATECLHFPGAVPYLIDAIKQNDSEVVRTNAADVLRSIYRECPSAAVSRLNVEGDKPQTAPEQRTRLQMAAEYVNNYFSGGPGPCRAENGEPSTEEQVQKNLDGRWGPE
jgi:hypothetical protein